MNFKSILNQVGEALEQKCFEDELVQDWMELEDEDLAHVYDLFDLGSFLQSRYNLAPREVWDKVIVHAVQLALNAEEREQDERCAEKADFEWMRGGYPE